MRIAYLAAAAAIFCSAVPVSAQTVNDRIDQSFGSGYVKASGVIMKRSDPSDGTYVASNPGGAPYVTNDDFDFEFEPGFDGTIGLYILPKHAIEVRTLQFDTSSGFTAFTPGGFIGGGFTGPGGTRFDVDYKTDLESWEANWRYEFNEHLTLLAGPRSIRLGDGADFVLNSGVARGFYDYQNDLLGAQIGAEVSVLPTTSPFSIDVSGKIGYYRLETAGGIREYQSNNFIGSFEGELEDETFAAEAGITAGYRPTDNILIFAGYQALFISDVALGAEAASRSLFNPSLLRSVETDDILFHGGKFGVSVIW